VRHHVRLTGWLTDCPPRYPQRRHQATVHYAAQQEPGDGWQRWSLAVLGIVMVLLQCIACVAVFQSMDMPSCRTNDQCGTGGTYCNGKVCNTCDRDPGGLGYNSIPVDPDTGLAFNTPFDPGSSKEYLPPGAVDWSGGYNSTTLTAFCAGEEVCGYQWMQPITSCHTVDSKSHALKNWCDACGGDGHPVVGTDGKVGTGRVDTTGNLSIMADNVNAMGTVGWLVLLLCSTVMAMSVVAELRDIELCLLALDRADPPLPAGWWISLRGLAIVRRYTFLPAMVVSVPMVVLNQGGDALSICFNTVAVLFLTEIE
jgi:hypothetical protein